MSRSNKIVQLALDKIQQENNSHDSEIPQQKEVMNVNLQKEETQNITCNEGRFLKDISTKSTQD